jgi:hypothetical protein
METLSEEIAQIPTDFDDKFTQLSKDIKEELTQFRKDLDTKLCGLCCVIGFAILISSLIIFFGLQREIDEVKACLGEVKTGLDALLRQVSMNQEDEAIDEFADASVRIEIHPQSPMNNSFASGTLVIIEQKPYVLTCAHVVAEDKKSNNTMGYSIRSVQGMSLSYLGELRLGTGTMIINRRYDVALIPVFAKTSQLEVALNISEETVVGGEPIFGVLRRRLERNS